ncbi:MAG TPA: DUF3299 domain-containing protein [Verrucomicrobiae bacterium]|nr:DUF3299 domain-containing protein [Verrucomicrobiae bacterium]
MRILILSLCLIVGGCKRESAQEPASDVRGQPIVATITSNAPASTNSAPATAMKKIGDYHVVGFDKLAAYNFEVSDDLLTPSTNTAAMAQRVDSQIPATVKAFNEKPVALTGFMLPLKVEGGLVTELLIMRDQSMCCYGVQPKINEWVSIKMTRAGVKPVMDQPVTLFGKLRVGEMRENGYLVGIYAMDGDKMDAPE